MRHRAGSVWPGITIPPLGVSCNLDLMGSGGWGDAKSDAQGESACGSMCAHGSPTRYLDKRSNAGFQAALEFEFSFGWLANGRAGISYEFEKTKAHVEQVTCDDTFNNDYVCYNQLVTAYARGCAGNGAISYCFNLSKTLFRDHEGECPPLDVMGENGPSPGTSAGQACANQSEEFWTWDHVPRPVLRLLQFAPCGGGDRERIRPRLQSRLRRPLSTRRRPSRIGLCASPRCVRSARR